MFCKCLNSLIVFILFLLSLFVNKTKRGISIPNLIIKQKKTVIKIMQNYQPLLSHINKLIKKNPKVDNDDNAQAQCF